MSLRRTFVRFCAIKIDVASSAASVAAAATSAAPSSSIPQHQQQEEPLVVLTASEFSEKVLGGATELVRNIPSASHNSSASSASAVVPVADVLASKDFVLLYFSAHWCPPCRQFTPILSKFYERQRDPKKLEVIFCSWDQNEAEFQQYFKTHPQWLAVDRSIVDTLANTYAIQTIPSLLVVDAKTGAVVTRKGRLGVAHDPMAEGFPWAGVDFASHVNMNAPWNAMFLGGAATVMASMLLWLFAQGGASVSSAAC